MSKQGSLAETAINKTCRSCNKAKKISQETWDSEFHAHTRNDRGVITRWQSLCKTCQAKDTRIRMGIKNTGKPYKKRKPALTPEQVRERARKRYKERMKDPEFARARREYHRMVKAAERREQGVPERQFQNVNGVSKTTDGTSYRAFTNSSEAVDAGPFLEWIDTHIARRGTSAWRELSELAGVSPDRLSRTRSTGRITLTLVDRLATAAGVSLSQIYPEH